MLGDLAAAEKVAMQAGHQEAGWWFGQWLMVLNSG